MKENKKKLINIIVGILIFIGISVGLYFLLKWLGVTDQASLHQIVSDTGAWAPIVFFALQVAVSTLLSVVPGTNFTFLILAGILFENIWLALALALLGVWVSSFLMFVLGKTLGEKVAVKLVGKESLARAQELIDTKTRVYLPIMFLVPFFPDDALCLAAGLTKLKYRQFIVMIILFRSAGAITTVLSSFYHVGIFNFLGLNTLVPIEWFLLINVILFDAYVIFKLTRKLEQKINLKRSSESDQTNQ